MNSLIVFLLIIFSISSYFFGRKEARKLVTNNITLNALPSYYGYYLALWCGLPALLIFASWSLFEPSILKLLILGNFPDIEAKDLFYEQTLSFFNGNFTGKINVDKKLVADNPFYAFATIPKGTYKTSKKDVTTFGVMASVVSSADVSDDLVYAVVKAVFENLDDFKKQHPAFANLDPKKMIKDGLSAPLHNGAIRYYKEAGLM